MSIVVVLVVRFFRRSSVKLWVTDVNPEQIVVLGGIRARSLPARLMDLFNRRSLKRFDDVIVLGRFLGDTMMRKFDVCDKLHTMPFCPHEDHLETLTRAGNLFRQKPDLQDKFVSCKKVSCWIG